MVSEATMKKLTGYADFVRTFSLHTYALDIRNVPFHAVEEIRAPLGLQPGLYLDGKIGSRMMGKKVLGEDFDNSKCVLIAEISNEEGINQYWGVIFHEYGHATFDAGKANGEPGAWTVELMALANYVQEVDKSLAGKARDYAKTRRASGCFGTFGKLSGKDYTSEAQAAYQAITGESL